MCGLVGIVAKKRPLSASILPEMVASLRHRGPDDSGTWLAPNGRIGLGHTRLSIIDLSPAGHQPMSDAERKHWIVFNGEIYNFQEIRKELEVSGCSFTSHTDTEVIIQAYKRWGLDCLRRFNGMFAFALYDQLQGRLVLARDRIGKKPLYYLDDADYLAFASESKSLLPLIGAGIDIRSLNLYLAYGYLPRDRSIFKGVQKLLPGEALVFDFAEGKSRVESYWELPLPAPAPLLAAPSSGAELVDQLHRLLQDSVRLRLIADVPLGILLSGGVDSSLVAAVAASVSSRPVKTFTITFPGGGRYDEASYARIVARHFGTDHYELPLDGQDWSSLEFIARHLDEPMGDPSILPTYALSKLIRQHVTVALGGDGGDELFGGYAWYERGLAAQRYLVSVPRFVRGAIAGLADPLPAGLKGRNLLRALGKGLSEFRIATSMAFDASLRRRVLRPEAWEALGGHQLEPERLGQEMWPALVDPMTQMSVWDLRMFLPEDILAKVDRASMAVALEVRAPWLDHRIIEFALRNVPSELKVRKASTRILQRLLAKRLLPPELDLNRKQGFVMPTHEWLTGAWAKPAGEVLTASPMSEWFNTAFIEDMLADLRRGYSNGVRLFALLSFGLWLQSRLKR
jgi:asparagine synthase (glutamine-hydrolysing)